MTVRLGDPFQFRCQIRSPQPFGLRWQRENEFVDPQGPPTLYARASSTLQDAGLYRAIATNAWGASTSTVARLGLLLPTPNPEVAGRRLESLFASGFALYSAGLVSLAPDSIDPNRIRWLDDRLALAGANPDGSTPAVFAHLPETLEVLFRTGGPMPGTPSPLTVARVIPAANAGDPLLILGGNTIAFRGIYRLETNTLLPLVDIAAPAPAPDPAGLPTETFTAFPGTPAQAGHRVAFVGRTTSRTGVYVWADDTLRRLVDTTQTLPAPARPTNFTAVGFDGEVAAVVAVGGGTPSTSLLRIAADGTVTSLLAAGEPVPETAPGLAPVAVFESPVVENGRIYFQCRDFSGRRYLCRWHEGAFHLLAHPGTTVADVGTVSRIETASLVVDAGRAYFTGRILAPDAPRSVILAASLLDDAVHLAPVIGTPSIGSDPAAQLTTLDVEDGRVAFSGVGTGANPRVTVYANTGAQARPAPIILLETTPPDDRRIRIAEGTLLESAPTLDGPWEYVPATEIQLSPPPPSADPARFYRVRWP